MAPNPLTPDVDWFDGEASGALVRFGFLGQGSRPGRWRLYLHPDLIDYVEFAESEVLNTEPVSRALSPLGGSMVWFKADARLQRVSTKPLDEQADFLRGPVTSGFLASAQAVNLGGGGFSPDTIVATIISFLIACPSHWIGCTGRCTMNCGETVLGFCPIYSIACTYEKRICG